MYSTNSQIKLKTSMIRSSLYDYSDASIHGKGTIIIPNTRSVVASHNGNKKVIFKLIFNCSPFTNCTSEINNTRVDDVHNFDVVIPMYNLIEHSDIYSKASKSL